MYDADFNTEGFGAPPASPYGVHGMDRSDTNAPSAFPGDVTAADPYPGQITADIQIDPRPAAAYAGASSAEVFADPNPSGKGYVYSVDPTTGAIAIVQAPPGRYAGPVQRGTPAYNAIYSLYLAQRKVGIPGALQAAAQQIGGAFAPAPSAGSPYVTTLLQQSSARTQRLLLPPETAKDAGVSADAGKETTAIEKKTESTGMSWTTWALILGGLGVAFYLYRQSAKK